MLFVNTGHFQIFIFLRENRQIYHTTSSLLRNISSRNNYECLQGFLVVEVELLNHVQLFCNPMDCSLSGSSVLGISQARILEWVAIVFSKIPAIFPTQGLNHISCITGRFFTTEPPTWDARVLTACMVWLEPCTPVILYGKTRPAQLLPLQPGPWKKHTQQTYRNIQPRSRPFPNAAQSTDEHGLHQQRHTRSLNMRTNACFCNH